MPSRLRVSFFLSMALSGACRAPAESSNKFPENIAEFDASVPDGGVVEPVAACLDGASRFNNNFSPALGGNDAVDVEVVHFSSFYCIHCADFYAYSHALWRNRDDFRARARIYFHHANYGFRHRAAVAAFNQGEGYFWELHDYIYDRFLAGKALSDGDIRSYVKNELELDMARFEQDVEADATYAFLKWELAQAQAAGVVGTPSVFVCGHEIYWYDLEDEVADQL